MKRAQRIKQHQERINALGLKHLSTFLPKCANVGRKRVSVQVDDYDYVPAIGDDELSSSLIMRYYIYDLMHAILCTL